MNFHILINHHDRVVGIVEDYCMSNILPNLTDAIRHHQLSRMATFRQFEASYEWTARLCTQYDVKNVLTSVLYLEYKGYEFEVIPSLYGRAMQIIEKCGLNLIRTTHII